MKVFKKVLKKFLKKIFGLRLDIRIRRNLLRIKRKKSKEKTNIIFIVQFSEMWNSLKSVYDSFKKSDLFNPILLAVPKYKHNSLKTGMNENEFYERNDAFIFLKTLGYDVIDARKNGQWKDLKDLNPDIVFYQRPYQPHYPKKYNFCKVSKYALVCFVPYGVLLSKDIHIRITINEDTFKSAYIFFTDDESAKKYFEENKFSRYSRAEIIKNPRFDLFSMSDIVKTINKPKTFLWTPRWYVGERNNKSNFLIYLKPLVSFFDEHKNLELIIRPHPLMFRNFIDKGVMTECEVDRLTEEISMRNNIKFDTNKDYKQTFNFADVLISDFSSLIIEFFLTGKPVIYCGEAQDFNELGRLISNYFIFAKDIDSLKSQIDDLSNIGTVAESARISCIQNIIEDKSRNEIFKIIQLILQSFYSKKE